MQIVCIYYYLLFLLEIDSMSKLKGTEAFFGNDSCSKKWLYLFPSDMQSGYPVLYLVNIPTQHTFE